MTDATTDVVLHEVRDRIATLILNRPDRLNAWTGVLARRYYSSLEDAAADPDVRVIVVTGAGRGWCAGADMDSLQGGGDSDDPGAVGLDRPIWFPTTIPKPIIAAINGACAGIGLCAALVCDLRFAAAGAKFTTAFVRRGLVAEHGSSWLLPRLVGHANALDLLLSGRVLLAEEAAAIGLVNRVVEPAVLLSTVMGYAEDLAANCSPAAMAAIKHQ